MICFLLCISFFAEAHVVQVPENCIDRISPCLIRSESVDFQFKHKGQLVKLLKDSIVKITFDEYVNNFNLIEGRLILTEKEKLASELVINSKSVRSGYLFISRAMNSLSILDMNDFVFNEYEIMPTKAEMSQVRSDFINKQDFVEFTKKFYSSTVQYKSFLSSIESSWKLEFNKQNRHQTKVLKRSIASELETAQKEQQRKAALSQELKKVRETFFYRTFLR